MEVPKHLIGCDAVECEKINATVQCRECKVSYYCSDSCLLNHKAIHQKACQAVISKQWICTEIASSDSSPPQSAVKGSVISVPRQSSSEDTNSNGDAAVVVQSSSVLCSICLEDPNSKTSPVVTLEACKHVFCLPCLIQWQRQSSSISLDHVDFTDPTVQCVPRSTLACPTCRTESESPEKNLLQKAKETCAQGKHPGCPVELKDKLLKDAFMITAALLQAQDPDLSPMLVMADVLLGLNRPADALATTRKLVKMDQERRAVVRGNPVLAWLERAHDWHEAGQVHEAERALCTAAQMAQVFAHDPAMVAMMATSSSSSRPPLLRGREREATYQSLYLIQGQAFEMLGKWQDALRMYRLLQSHQAQAPDTMQDVVEVQVWKGLAACCYNTQDYAAAIDAAHHAIAMDRSSAGVHRYLALSLARQARGEPKSSPEKATNLLLQSILTMNQAVLYEAPWDPRAQASNLELFRALQHEFAVGQEATAATVAVATAARPTCG